MVLGNLVQQGQGLSNYATVSKEWQAHIERENFSQIKLTAPCLDMFAQIVIRQRQYVKSIWLNIELPRYTCVSCRRRESISNMRINNAVVGRAVSKLFAILGSWPPAQDALTWELSVQSPSDKEHFGRGIHFGTEQWHPSQISAPRMDMVARHNHNLTRYGWNFGIFGLSRMFGLIDLAPLRLQRLPEVHAIPRWVIGRQCRRYFMPQTLILIDHKLPRMEALVHESWQISRRLANDQRYDWDTDSATTTIYIPSSSRLRRMCLFEDFDDNYLTMMTHVPPLVTNLAHAEALARRSLPLRIFSCSFVIDAQHFFLSLEPDWSWPNLESLALTSRVLVPTADQEEVVELLVRAAQAALRMPNLQTMTLWNGRRSMACAFTYSKTNDENHCPSIAWRGTWDLEFPPHLIQAWEEVVSTFTLVKMRTAKEFLDPGTIRSHGDAVEHLQLVNAALDQASVQQIQREANR
ncbi:hypothetical protein B0T10DRAFT_497825 [Thelonectria olida]|uniref:DUF6546 domain-containing protein n=1 Tax=Thelonectria olida TaxID=1576542 RepID=A0A9P8VUQ1_9HYPO|nr:hypothetical protein B0T10DRAFT_497825 [Thelonectria olida]